MKLAEFINQVILLTPTDTHKIHFDLPIEIIDREVHVIESASIMLDNSNIDYSSLSRIRFCVYRADKVSVDIPQCKGKKFGGESKQ